MCSGNDSLQDYILACELSYRSTRLYGGAHQCTQCVLSLCSDTNNPTLTTQLIDIDNEGFDGGK